MKKQINLPLLATLCGAILFNYLFWMEAIGINLLLYSTFIMIIILLNKEVIKHKKIWASGASHLFTAILLVFNHSILTLISWFVSLAIFIGFAYLPTLRSIFAAITAALLQAITAPVNLVKELITVKMGNFSIKPLFKPIKYIILPIILVVLFSILYSLANSTFANYLDIILSSIGNFIADVFNFFFADISFIRALHFVLGLLFTAALLLKYYNETLEQTELSFLEKLLRTRRAKKQAVVLNGLVVPPAPNVYHKKMALKTMNIIGIISFIALNLLIFSLNLVDISSLWITEPKPVDFNYSAELHEGTNILIWSIILAMMVILYFFRGNLNFYSKNKSIKLLSYIWIVQNTFLVASVLLRDYNYIDIHGLTYKRIGVVVFLLLCLIGLITVYLKVSKQKSFFYLVKTNGFVWYALLLISGVVNWDVLIMSYNMNNKHEITVNLEHTMRLSDKVIPLLDKNKDLLKTYFPINNRISAGDPKLTYTQEQQQELDKYIKVKIDQFKDKWENTTWLSWNYRDWQTYQYLKGDKR
jgi:hypothetical protein